MTEKQDPDEWRGWGEKKDSGPACFGSNADETHLGAARLPMIGRGRIKGRKWDVKMKGRGWEEWERKKGKSTTT